MPDPKAQNQKTEFKISEGLNKKITWVAESFGSTPGEVITECIKLGLDLIPAKQYGQRIFTLDKDGEQIQEYFPQLANECQINDSITHEDPAIKDDAAGKLLNRSLKLPESVANTHLNKLLGTEECGDPVKDDEAGRILKEILDLKPRQQKIVLRELLRRDKSSLPSL